MKEFFKDIARDKTITSAFFANIFFIITSIIYILFFYGNSLLLFLFLTQLPWGEQRLGNTLTIFIPAGASLLILIINIFVSTSIYKNIPLISRMLVAISLLAGILTFLFSIKIITLII